jgi:uncharacterized protein YcfJ
MHKLIAFSTLLIASGICLADDVGRVISTTPVVQQVGVPRKVCTTEQVAVQQQKSGAGAAMGAIAGGAIGNQVGRGAGNAAATMLGIVGGAILGDKIEGSPPAQVQDVQHCSTQVFYENRTVAYNVVYEFGGKQYSVQMPQDPGPTIRLQVTPIGATTQGTTSTYSTAPVEYAQTPTTTVVVPAAPVYYAPSPVTVGVGFGYWDHRHWH